MSKFVLNLSGRCWDHLTGPKQFSLKGAANLNGNPIGAAQLFEQLNTATTPEALTQVLERLNGFYTWVLQEDTRLLAAVDHIRSRPIFYGHTSGRFYLSDDAEWVRQQVADIAMDPIAREEFLLSGYVTGQDTLYPDVKQLQAGEFLEVEHRKGELYINTHRFFRFWHTEPEFYDEIKLRQKLEEVTMNVMRRLTKYAAGRQLVVPLSGGYDSRLIVTMLKRLGYENVLCFTYGVPGNKEAEYSQKVAETLGFKWVFIEYSTSGWQEAWRSTAAEDYKRTAANHVSLPHVQDWLAIRELVVRKYIDNESILVPGHSGDFVAGSHIPSFVFEKKQHSEDSLLQALIKNNLSNAPKDGMSLASTNKLSDRVRDCIGSKFDGSDVQFANLYELWDWQERQSKYIVNSVRVYEQFGLHWWLPFWDVEFLQFWESVPLILRKKRVWFVAWIDDKYKESSPAMSSKDDLGNAAEQSMLFKTLVKIAKKLPSPIQHKLKRNLHRRKVKSHSLAFEGLVTDGNLKSYLSKKYNMIGIYSELYIKSKW